MRRNYLSGERLFVDYADMTVPFSIDGKKHEAQVLVATMGVSGWLRSATGSRSAAISPTATVRAVLTLLFDNAGPDRPHREVAMIGDGIRWIAEDVPGWADSALASSRCR